MKLKNDLFYYCVLRKPSATLKKIRCYCAPSGCPHLLVKARRNCEFKKRFKFISKNYTSKNKPVFS